MNKSNIIQIAEVITQLRKNDIFELKLKIEGKKAILTFEIDFTHPLQNIQNVLTNDVNNIINEVSNTLTNNSYASASDEVNA